MKRTKKEFTDYNDYHDRSFGLKWGPAFALAELTHVIRTTKQDALKVNEALPVMTREAIDDVLQLAFLKSQDVIIQLGLRDSNDNLYDSLQGSFTGLADKDNIYINDIPIAWENIRHVGIVKKED